MSTLIAPSPASPDTASLNAAAASTAAVSTAAVAQAVALVAARTAGRMAGPFLRPVQLLIAWPVASQITARHNAKAAEEELLVRRAEREDVEHYLRLLASERMPA